MMTILYRSLVLLCLLLAIARSAKAFVFANSLPDRSRYAAAQSASFVEELWHNQDVDIPMVDLTSVNVTCTIYEIGGDLTKVLSTTCSKKLPLIPHVGVRVFGKEFFYSDHIESRPTAVMAQMLGTFPQVSFDLGPPTLSEEEFLSWLNSPDLQSEWSPEAYNVFDHNCNHFAKVLMDRIASHPLPDDRIIPVLKVTEDMLSELPDWRRNLGLSLMNQVTRLVVVSWGRATRNEKKRLEEASDSVSFASSSS